jgi:hypothetical protein
MLWPVRTLKARPVGERGVHERRGEVDPAAGRLQHPLDQIADIPFAQRHRQPLRNAVAGDEHPVGAVDPDLLDRRVVEQRLERPQPGELCHHLPCDGGLVAEQRHRASEGALAVPAHLVVSVPPGQGVITREVDPVAPHPRSNGLGDVGDRAAHRVIVPQRCEARPGLSPERGDHHCWASKRHSDLAELSEGYRSLHSRDAASTFVWCRKRMIATVDPAITSARAALQRMTTFFMRSRYPVMHGAEGGTRTHTPLGTGS